MGDEMDRDVERTRPSGEQAGVRSTTTYPDDSQPVDEPRQPVDEPRQPVDEPRQPVDEPRQAVDEPRQPVDEPRQAVDAERTPRPAGRAPSRGAEDFDLLGDGELASVRDRWAGVQATFVDDPAGAARQADTMVGEMLDRLQRRHRELHEEAGGRTNGEADTEAHRIQFLRYRSFLRTLLG